MELYLVTGFLGAGKTTFLKKFVSLFASRKLAVIVNEFGKEAVDAELLRPLLTPVTEIAGGAVFCSCRVNEFEQVLHSMLRDEFEVVVVEASGLADPSNINKILEQSAFAKVDYKGSICLVDGVNFEKVLQTVRVCKKQLEISRIVLLNKSDLVPQDEIENRIKTIQELVPYAVVYPTSYGQFKQEWLEQGRKIENNEPRHQTKDVGLQKKTVYFQNISHYQLQKFAEMIAEDTHRIKGFVECSEGVFYVDGVGSMVTITPRQKPKEANYCLTILAGANLPMEKALAKAVAWYPAQIKRVE